MKPNKMFRVWVFVACAVSVGALTSTVAAPLSDSRVDVDDFSTDTTADYITYYWPYANSQGAIVSVQYDAPSQRALLRAVGGYGWTLMTKEDAVVEPGQDFEFSCDIDVLSEFTGSLYIGDKRPPESGTYVRLWYNTYLGDDLVLRVVVNGTRILQATVEYDVGSGCALKIARDGAAYRFYCNDNLFWEETLPELDTIPLCYGVQNAVTSGASGWTAQTAVDNWRFTSRTKLDSGLFGYWDFDEDSGTMVFDRSGHGKHCQLYGAVREDGVGVAGRALSFDGVNDYLAFPVLNDGSKTFSLWFATSATDFKRLLSYDAGYFQDAWNICVRDDKLKFLSREGDSAPLPELASETAVNDGRWHHACVVLDSDAHGMWLYLDGTEVDHKDMVSDLTMFDHVFYGMWDNFNTYAGTYTPGKLDEVRIYERALSAAEVKQLHECVKDTWHADGQNGDDNNDGMTRETAFASIQTGMDAALHLDTVVVWPGVYDEGCDFSGKSITVTSAADAAVVRNPDGYAFAFNNAEGPDSVLQNLVLAGGLYGVYTGVGCAPTLKNLTIADNEFGVTCYENAEPAIVNCILANEIGDLEGGDVRYSWVKQDKQAMYDAGLIDASGLDPGFADPNSGDYHLLSARGRYRATTDEWLLDAVTSPCVDAGDPMEDPSGEPYPNGGRVNMGAYGNTVYASRSEWPLVHDSNRDGRVNLGDLAAMAGEWLNALPWAE